MGGDRAIFVVAHFHRQGIDPERSHGHVRSLLAERARTVAHRFIADGDHVVVEAGATTSPGQGVRYDNDYCLVFRLEDGKIREIREYCDSVLTEKALGNVPADRIRAG